MLNGKVTKAALIGLRNPGIPPLPSPAANATMKSAARNRRRFPKRPATGSKIENRNKDRPYPITSSCLNPVPKKKEHRPATERPPRSKRRWANASTDPIFFAANIANGKCATGAGENTAVLPLKTRLPPTNEGHEKSAAGKCPVALFSCRRGCSRRLRLHANYLLRLLYSPVRVSISILSPCSTNKGTDTLKPVEIFAGFKTLPEVSPLTAGSV